MACGTDGAGAGIGETALQRWIAQAEVEAGRGPEGALTRSERAELVELRRKNQRLRIEREILKNSDHLALAIAQLSLRSWTTSRGHVTFAAAKDTGSGNM